MKFVPEQLRKAAGLYEERNALYGDNYKKFGEAVAPLLEGVNLESVSDFNRIGILVQIIAKVTRYCANFEKGGHDDSLKDMAVYAMMLLELDTELRQQDEIKIVENKGSMLDGQSYMHGGIDPE